MNSDKLSALRNRLEADGFKSKGGVLRGSSPFRPGSNSDGFVINLGDFNSNIGWYDHVTEARGHLSDLANHYGIVDFDEPENGPTSLEPEYIYQDETGQPIYKVIRKPGKKFLQMHYCSDINGWAWGLGGNPAKCGCKKVEMLPYQLPGMIANPNRILIIPEGEKDVHAANELGFEATCNSGGAGKWGKLPKKVYRHFENRPVIIIADNDGAGRKHADEVAKALWPYAESVKIVRFNGPQGYDLTDWVRDGGDKQTLQSIIGRSKLFQLRIEADVDNPLASEPPDDEGNAQCVHYLHGTRFLYTDELGWLKYTGSHWEGKGAEASLNRSIVDTLIQRRILAVQNDDEKLVRAAKPSANNVKNARFMFQSIVWASIDEFDAEPDLLNCKSGPVDLRTGQASPHEANQRFTYCIDTAYDPAADDTAWVEWLHSTVAPVGIDDNGQYAELVNWLQMAVGYSLTGHTHEQCLFFLQGPPRGGKGIFLQILDKLLGHPLASGVDFDTFTAKRGGDNQNFDLAPLKTCRLITASESERASMINAKRVKSITGNDPIHCAHKRKAFFTYTPQFKIWLSSNFQIMAAADDDALWSRIRIVNFPNCHLGNENYSLYGQMWESRAGILKWAIEGAMIWYQRKADNMGLGQPDMVRGAVKMHRADNDTVAMFIEDCCSVEPDQYAVGAQLSAAYRDWCKDNGINPLGGRRLGESMRGKGFESKKKRLSPTNVKKCWLGIGLLV